MKERKEGGARGCPDQRELQKKGEKTMKEFKKNIDKTGKEALK